VLDVLVAKVVLQGAGVVAIIGEFEAAGMAQHVRMHGKSHVSDLAEALDEMMKTHWADLARHARKRRRGLPRGSLA
jgi:hypothetical protein